ncbi:aminoglycoside phosphotransferase family protein [Paenibacillus sp. GCM10027626]|uniref:aminoglycoside phosphotransferase family protein n=1 Tax=Paenibacillus sp. GCM10027626 TaxID=3273411 RepID=UPI00363B9E87
MIRHLSHVLHTFYDIKPVKITPQQGGWAALAFKVQDEKRTYFLKMYEKSRASTAKWTALIDTYVPVTVWLMNNSRLQGKLPVPIATNKGTYKCEDEAGVYLLYSYIEGATIGEKQLTAEQAGQLAECVAELHRYPAANFPLDLSALTENYEVPFLQPLHDRLEGMWEQEWNEELKNVLRPHRKQLVALIDTMLRLSRTLQQRHLPLVFCHTDLHNWNLMQAGGQLILLDWEGLKLAPAEADMMSFTDKAYFRTFLAIYRERHPQYTVDPDVLQFYRGRRKLEDVWEFMEQLLFDQQTAEDRADSLNHLQRELSELTEVKGTELP